MYCTCVSILLQREQVDSEDWWRDVIEFQPILPVDATNLKPFNFQTIQALDRLAEAVEEQGTSQIMEQFSTSNMQCVQYLSLRVLFRFHPDPNKYRSRGLELGGCHQPGRKDHWSRRDKSNFGRPRRLTQVCSQAFLLAALGMFKFQACPVLGSKGLFLGCVCVCF